MFGRRFGLGAVSDYVASSAQAATLAQIAQNESGGNYTATNPKSTASGAYQIINSTWQMAAANVGIDTSLYPTAKSAPPAYQDAAALWLLQTYGPNATISWAASAPPGGYPTDVLPAGISPARGDGPLIDLSGVAASTPTADILNQIDTTAASVFAMDSGSGILLTLGIAAGLAMALSYARSR